MPRLFKRNILAPVPPGAEVREEQGRTVALWRDVDGRAQERPVVTTGKGSGRTQKIITGEAPRWSGKVRLSRGRYRSVQLFTDKTASERELRKLQIHAEHRASGIITADTERLALPVADLVAEYVTSLRARKVAEDHARITEWMLKRLVAACGWKLYNDITPASVEKALPGIATTAGYQNKFIARGKAFVHWVLPDGCADPLKKLRRVREKGAKKTRGRRAAADAEIRALFALQIPHDRKLAYALAAFNGLRRNEAARLSADDVDRAATTKIPFLGIRRKQGQDDTLDYIPIHPYVLKLMAGRMLMPGARVLPSVPDMKTVARDLLAAGIAAVTDAPGPGRVYVSKGRYINIGDGSGRRLDYHALRHTFQTGLDRTGCSRATKKKLMRHASGDVTDGYAHAELEEMLAAIQRLPSPVSLPATALATGTDDRPVAADRAPRAHQKPGRHRLASAGIDAVDPRDDDHDRAPDTPVFSGPIGLGGVHRRSSAGIALNLLANADIVGKTRPSTQVD